MIKTWKIEKSGENTKRRDVGISSLRTLFAT